MARFLHDGAVVTVRRVYKNKTGGRLMYVPRSALYQAGVFGEAFACWRQTGDATYEVRFLTPEALAAEQPDVYADMIQTDADQDDA